MTGSRHHATLSNSPVQQQLQWPPDSGSAYFTLSHHPVRPQSPTALLLALEFCESLLAIRIHLPTTSSNSTKPCCTNSLCCSCCSSSHWTKTTCALMSKLVPLSSDDCWELPPVSNPTATIDCSCNCVPAHKKELTSAVSRLASAQPCVLAVVTHSFDAQSLHQCTGQTYTPFRESGHTQTTAQCIQPTT